MNIALDADGVLFDTETFQFKYTPKYFSKKHSMQMVDENAYRIKDMFNCSESIEMAFWRKYYINYSLFYKPRKYVTQVIKSLHLEGHKIYIITSKALALDKKVGYIVRLIFETGLKLSGIKVDGIHYCSLNNSAMDKAEKCRQLGIDVFVEDNTDNVFELSKYTTVLCMNTKNNQGCKGDNITRVENFSDVYAEIRKIADSKSSVRSAFTTFQSLSKHEKKQLSLTALKDYYQKQIEYCMQLPFDIKKMRKGERWFLIFQKVLRLFFYQKYHPKVIGKERIPNEKGIIFVTNHLCNKDFILISSSLKGIVWHLLIKKEVLYDSIGTIFSLVDSIFVDRNENLSRNRSIQELTKILLHGGNILIAPEGTYNKTTDNLLPFKGNSAVYLSQMLDKYIIPIAITEDYGKGQHPIVRISNPIKIQIDEDLEEANMRLWSLMGDMVEENKHSHKELII